MSVVRFAPKRPAPLPPVLAPKDVVDGGGPAGVVEGFGRLPNSPLPALGAGVVDPKSVEAEAGGAVDLSGVPTLPNRGFGVSVALFSSGLEPNENDGVDVLVDAGAAPNRDGAGLFSAPDDGGFPKPEKENPVLPVPDAPELLPKSPPAELPSLFVVPNKP